MREKSISQKVFTHEKGLSGARISGYAEILEQRGQTPEGPSGTVRAPDWRQRPCKHAQGMQRGAAVDWAAAEHQEPQPSCLPCCSPEESAQQTPEPDQDTANPCTGQVSSDHSAITPPGHPSGKANLQACRVIPAGVGVSNMR